MRKRRFRACTSPNLELRKFKLGKLTLGEIKFSDSSCFKLSNSNGHQSDILWNFEICRIFYFANSNGLPTSNSPTPDISIFRTRDVDLAPQMFTLWNSQSRVPMKLRSFPRRFFRLQTLELATTMFCRTPSFLTLTFFPDSIRKEALDTRGFGFEKFDRKLSVEQKSSNPQLSTSKEVARDIKVGQCPSKHRFGQGSPGTYERVARRNWPSSGRAGSVTTAGDPMPRSHCDRTKL